jgi:Endosomal/lysosomal potassium channel TMEM175
MPERIPFRNRAHEVSRIEAFSDVIFGFAISLLVVSLEAPRTYAQMLEMLHGFLPFAICFWIFIDIWFEHHHFYKRYALQDQTTMALNTFLLFVILFYVYPLKYIFTLFTQGILGQRVDLPESGVPFLYTIYGIGVTSVFWLLAAMYGHAWRCRAELGLNDVEVIDTLERVYDDFFMGLFGVISIVVAHSRWSRYAGLVYFLICIPKTLVPWIMGVKRKKREEAMLAATASA